MSYLSVPGPRPATVSHSPAPVLTPRIFASRCLPPSPSVPRLNSNAASDVRPFQVNVPDILRASTNVCRVTNGRASPTGYEFPCLASLSRSEVLLESLSSLLLGLPALAQLALSSRGYLDLFPKSLQGPRQSESFPTCIVQAVFTSILVKHPSFFLSLFQTMTFLEACCVLRTVSGSRDLPAREATAAVLTEHAVRGQTDPAALPSCWGHGALWGHTAGGASLPLGSQPSHQRCCLSGTLPGVRGCAPWRRPRATRSPRWHFEDELSLPGPQPGRAASGGAVGGAAGI